VAVSGELSYKKVKLQFSTAQKLTYRTFLSRSQLQSHNLGLAVDVGYHRHRRRPWLLPLGGSNEAALRLNDLLKGRPHLFHRDVFQVPFQQRQLDVLEPAFPVGRRSF
jgi:hypothetical protein